MFRTAAALVGLLLGGCYFAAGPTVAYAPGHDVSLGWETAFERWAKVPEIYRPGAGVFGMGVVVGQSFRRDRQWRGGGYLAGHVLVGHPHGWTPYANAEALAGVDERSGHFGVLAGSGALGAWPTTCAPTPSRFGFTVSLGVRYVGGELEIVLSPKADVGASECPQPGSSL